MVLYRCDQRVGVAFQIMELWYMQYHKNEFMNWAVFLHADGNAVIFSLTDYPTLHV